MKYLIAILGLLSFTAVLGADYSFPPGISCTISWAANAPDEEVDVYDVAVGPVGGPEAYRTEIAEGRTVTCATAGIDTSAAGQTWVEARAHNRYGWSDPSPRIIVAFGSPPSFPRDVTVTRTEVRVIVETTKQ